MEFKVYPKVKVRQEEEEDHPSEFQRIFLKDFKSLSLYDHHPSNSNSNSSSNSKSPGANISSTSTTKVNKNNIAKPASSVLPPRAVLSSPENDAMLGTKNVTKTDQNHHQNTHNKCNKSYQLDKKRSKTKTSWK